MRDHTEIYTNTRERNWRRPNWAMSTLEGRTQNGTQVKTGQAVVMDTWQAVPPVDKEEAGNPCRRRRVCSASRVQGEPRKGPATWTLTMASWCLRGRRKGKLTLQTWGGSCKPPGRLKLKRQLTLRNRERGDTLRPPQRKDRDGTTRSFENTLKSTGGTGPDTARSLIHASA